MLVFRARIHKMLVRIASRTDPDQPASVLSDLGLHCVLGLFGRQRNFRTFTVINSFVYILYFIPQETVSCGMKYKMLHIYSGI